LLLLLPVLGVVTRWTGEAENREDDGSWRAEIRSGQCTGEADGTWHMAHRGGRWRTWEAGGGTPRRRVAADSTCGLGWGRVGRKLRDIRILRNAKELSRSG
jgi:hypothetical protein